MEKLTAYEKRAARALDVTAADVRKVGRNSCGDVYRLSNSYFLTEATCAGYSRAEVYRILVRKLIRQASAYL